MGNSDLWAAISPEVNTGDLRGDPALEVVKQSDSTVSIPQQTGEALAKELDAFCKRSGALYAALLSEHGVCVAHAGIGREQFGRSPELPALAVGAFFATRELAVRVGQQEFEGLFQQGGDRHLFLSPAGDSFLLLVVFGPPSNIGIIRLCAGEAAARIEALVSPHPTGGPKPAAEPGQNKPAPPPESGPLSSDNAVIDSLRRPAPTDRLKPNGDSKGGRVEGEIPDPPSPTSIFAPNIASFAQLELPNQPFPSG